MNVLSLFDGISCGMVALERAGIKVGKYYASEIEESSIKISQKNYPQIVRLGDVNNWREWDIEWQSIDLLIGGSPCQGFSFAGKQLNFEDPRSKLFFVYVAILNHIKAKNPNVKFFLENVKMKTEYSDLISEYLGVSPVRIQSSLVSAARRDRLYWCNFEITVPDDKGITFDDINGHSDEWLSDEYIGKVSKWKAQQDPIANTTYIGAKQKLPCLTARGYNQSHSGMILISDGSRYRYLTNNEAELAMTLPLNYTEGATDKERATSIGNGWTVDVIAHIFSFIPKEKYETAETESTDLSDAPEQIKTEIIKNAELLNERDGEEETTEEETMKPTNREPEATENVEVFDAVTQLRHLADERKALASIKPENTRFVDEVRAIEYALCVLEAVGI